MAAARLRQTNNVAGGNAVPPHPSMPHRAGAHSRAGWIIFGWSNRRGCKDYRYLSADIRTSGLSGRHGINCCGDLVIRRPRLQRGSHGDRGEPEHIV
jgi:hypothetical protein